MAMDERAEAMMLDLAPCLDDLSGAERDMTEDMLRTFCWYSVQIDDLVHELDVEGVIIDTPKGFRANPANAVLHQYTQRRGDIYAKVLKVISGSGSVAADRLAEFVR